MDDRLILTKSRLVSLQMQGPGLRNICSQFITKNIDLFLNDYQKRSQLARLPAVLRQLVLEELAKATCWKNNGDMLAFKQKVDAVRVLLNSETKSFKMDWLMSFCPAGWKDAYTEMLFHKIASRAPKISTLSRNYEETYINTSDALWCSDIWPLNLHILSSISKMTYLSHLEVTKYTLKFHEVTELCQTLKNLKHLRCNIVIKNFRVEVKPKHLELLSNLTEFLFDVSTDHGNSPKGQEFRMKLALYCLQYLPQLAVVGDYADNNKFYLEPNPDFVFKEASNLRQLAVLANCPLTENQCQMMPSVTDLKIKWNQNCGDNIRGQLLEFKKVDCIFLENLPSMEMWHCIMLKYGESLRSLDLMNWDASPMSLSFKKIFTFCPELQKLFLYGIDVVEESEPYDPQKTFASLRDLTWYGNFKRSEVSKILSAPNLEKVQLKRLSFKWKDVQKVSNRVADRLILKHLTYFGIDLYSADKESSATFSACVDLFKNVCAFAPKVVKIKLDEDLEFTDYSSDDEDCPLNVNIFRNPGEERLKQFIAALKEYA